MKSNDALFPTQQQPLQQILTTVAMALITRAIPQINVFMIAPPFQIIIGFTMIALSLNASIFMFQHLFEKMADNLHTIILEMGEASKINS